MVLLVVCEAAENAQLVQQQQEPARCHGQLPKPVPGHQFHKELL